ncbi:uncharacterized protein LOC118272742 [Spodoptera frugiperda]|uniref:Uncharacterized protein LOC118272742 n=1 Tax=Spodoptera frugiperda TaxID=7108 RepID=A0A9R0EMN9_SPOFR|nr:uncharacterized protein LOC118272742 [Spodoptera frugiperda]
MSFDTANFIMEVKNRPCLWDSTSTDYSDRNLKSKCWNELVDIFKEKDVMTKQEKHQLVYTLQKRWKGIRGCFTRELNRQKSLKSGNTGPRKSEYVFFKQLLFLQKVVALREPEVVEEREVPEPSTDSETTDREVETTDLDLQQDRLPKRIKTKQETEEDQFLIALKRSIKRREEYKALNQDEDRLFMLSLVGTLKQVPPHKKMATKIKIMSVLEEATSSVYNVVDSA